MLKEFKEFAMRGNVIDLAVGVIIGGAFALITQSVINDLMMPLIGKAVGNVDFKDLYLVLSGDVPEKTPLEEARKIEGATIFAWGNFITVVINFLLLAFCVFLLVKGINSTKKKEAAAPAAPPATPEDVILLREIRDSLKK